MTSRRAPPCSRSRCRACRRPSPRSPTSARSPPRRPPTTPTATRHAVPDGHARGAQRRRRARVPPARATKQQPQDEPAKAKPRRAKTKRADANTQAGDRRASSPRPTRAPTSARRHADAPTKRRTGRRRSQNPTVSIATPGPAPHRRAQLLHREVPHPAVPAPDLPGRRDRVRRALGGARGDQRDRDRLRPQPQRLLGRRPRAGCSSCPRPGRCTASTATATASKDPYNPVDAIFAAARYLKAAGADQDLRAAIFAYNHADWYVDSVLLRARLIGGLPGRPRRLAHRPDAGPLPGRGEGDLRQGASPGATSSGAAAATTPRTSSTPTRARNGIKIFARAGAPVDRGQRRPDRARRAQRAARPLRQAPGRLRQHLHLRAPRQGRGELPDAQAAHGRASGRSRAS